MRAVVRSGVAAPGGGRFDRFEVSGQPVVAPVNARGQVAFFATVLRAPAREGIFLAGAGGVRRVAAFGDDLPGGGALTEFGAHPLASLNAAGHVAFVAQIAGGRATEGVFLAGSERVAIDDEGGVAFGSYLGETGSTREALLRIGPDGLAEIAVEGAPAPGGGRYAGFGPWPTVAPSGVTAFIAALNGGSGPLAAFAGSAGDVRRVAAMGERLLNGESIGRFAPMRSR